MFRFYYCLILALVIFLIPNIYAQTAPSTEASSSSESATENEAGSATESATENEAGSATESATENEAGSATEAATENESAPPDEATIVTESAPGNEATSGDETASGKGGCLIATATYGSEIAPQVQQLRELRDNTLLQTHSGSAFMTGFNTFYYSFSPTIADLERQNPVFKEAVKITITPLLSTLSLLSLPDIDTEDEMLGFGIGIILLNIGMYFVAPAVLINSIRKRMHH